MKIVVKKINEPPKVVDVEKLELEDMQAMVGGYIECLALSNTVDLWLNEEGKLIPLKANLFLRDNDGNFTDVVCGDVFAASHDDEGGTVGLSDEDASWVMDELSNTLAVGECPLTGESGIFPVITW